MKNPMPSSLEGSYITYISEILGNIFSERDINVIISKCFIDQGRPNGFDPQIYGVGWKSKQNKLIQILEDYHLDDQLEIIQALCNNDKYKDNKKIKDLMHMLHDRGFDIELESSVNESFSSNVVDLHLQQLINEADEIPIVTGETITHPDREQYMKWLSKVKLFAGQHLDNHPLKRDLDSLIFHSKSRMTDIKDIKGLLVAILDSCTKTILSNSNPVIMKEKSIVKTKPLIFISHCEENIPYSDELISLFQRMGVPDDLIFSYSSPGHNLSIGDDIYEGLKNRLKLEQKTLVIFLLSDDFYKSPDCLNEMGAAWVVSKEQVGILIPPFDYKHIKGVIGKSKIHIKINDNMRLNDLRDKLSEFCEMHFSAGNKWEKMRNDFINNCNRI